MKRGKGNRKTHRDIGICKYGVIFLTFKTNWLQVARGRERYVILRNPRGYRVTERRTFADSKTFFGHVKMALKQFHAEGEHTHTLEYIYMFRSFT